MCTTAKLLNGRIDATAADGVHWEPRSALVATVSHFPELKAKLEVFVSRHSTDLMKDEADVLWTRVRVASDSLASYVPSSIARNPPNGAG
jgi:hypothetical protein